MPGSAEPSPGRPSAARARTIVALLAFAAYLPSLLGGFTFDDDRFIQKNPAVHHLNLRNLVRYFDDPLSVASVGTEGIYRPLRTLDFAIDWAVSGGSPWFFHLRNVLYHVLGCLLLLAVLRRLLGEHDPGGAGAFFGAALFAVHPVSSECVAWITSRGDLLLIVGFLLALHLHLGGRRWFALLALVVALLSKEAAVVFPAAALLADLFRRERLRFAWYGAYAVVVAGYVLLWWQWLAAGDVAHVGHLSVFWGGSYGANLLTMSKGFLYYVQLMAFPVRLAVDYHVPVATGLSGDSAVSILVLLVIALGAVLAGRRSRFALAWFLVTILPMSNLIRPIGIPTAERFLYLPLVGVVLWAGPFVARSRRFAWCILSCFLVLTFLRCPDWWSSEKLWDATEAVTTTPRSLAHRADRELELALAAKERARSAPPRERDAELEEMERHALESCRKADELIELYATKIRLPAGRLGSIALTNKAKSLLLLERPKPALEALDAALKLDELPDAYYHAGVALNMLGRHEEAALNIEAAVVRGYRADFDIRGQLARLWSRIGVQKEAEGKRGPALAAYRKSLEWLPPEKNPDAARGVERLR